MVGFHVNGCRILSALTLGLALLATSSCFASSLAGKGSILNPIPSELEDVSEYRLVGEPPQKTAGSASGQTESIAATVLSHRFYDFGLHVINWKTSADDINTSLLAATQAFSPSSDAVGSPNLGTLQITPNQFGATFPFDYAGGLTPLTVELTMPMADAQSTVDELVVRKFVVGQEVDSAAKVTGQVHMTGVDAQGTPFDLTYSEVFHSYRHDYSSGR